MGKSRVCAYCGEGGVLTKEHVFPGCFQKTFKPITPTRTPDGEKAILSPLEIQDVCARCNNELLSPLDEYLCELNDLYFSKIVRPGDRVRFQYAWDFLLRMLPKIAYNVARARKELSGPLFLHHPESESPAVLVLVNSRLAANSQAISCGVLSP